MNSNLEKYYPLLVEIRNRLARVLFLFAAGFLLGFVLYEHLVTFILGLFSFEGVNIVFTTPFQFFTLAINCGLVVGVVTILPVLIYETLRFLRPALKTQEYRVLVNVLPLGLALFAGGFAYGVAMMKYLVQIFYQSSVRLQIGNILDVENFLSKILATGLLMGLAFLFPIVITVLMQLKLVHYRSFSSQRQIAYLIGIIFVIFLPPPDLASDVILFFPLVVLFELTLLLNRIFLKTHLM